MEATAARAARAVCNDNPRDGHRLCNLSCFEFYRPASVGGNPTRGLFIQQFPSAMRSDVCKVAASVAREAQYLNELKVTRADPVNGSWKFGVTLPTIEGVDYGDANTTTTFFAYCRASSSPQRTFVKESKSGKIHEVRTTVSRRRRLRPWREGAPRRRI